MNSPPSSPLFARKGSATPTPVPGDGIGLGNHSSSDPELPSEDETGTVVSFDRDKSFDLNQLDSRAEAGSMLKIRLAPRGNSTAPSPQAEKKEDDPPASGSVALLPVPDAMALVVIDDQGPRDEPGFGAKWRKIILYQVVVLAAILAGGAYYALDRARDPAPVSVIIPTQPALLETPIDPIPPILAGSEKPDAAALKPTGSYTVQLASLPTHRDAKRELQTLERRHGALLTGLNLQVVPGSVSGKGRVWRIRAAGLPSRNSAERACRRIRARIKSCLVLRRR